VRIASVSVVLPRHRYDQRSLTDYLVDAFGETRIGDRLRSLHENTQVGHRHLALPLEAYKTLTDFTKRNAAWLKAAQELGAAAIEQALQRAGVRPEEVDIILFSTVTGIASPSIDARLLVRLGLRSDVKRMPLFGLGCVGGAAAVARAADVLRGSPDGVALVLCVELCSLTLLLEDRSVANLISVGLFGDGAAAAVVVGSDHRAAGVEITATRSVFYPDTEQVMGWDIGAHGFRIVLSSEVPELARTRVPCDVDVFLGDHGFRRSQITHWIAHPGGPKVLAGLQSGLGLNESDLRCSWMSLAEAGNLSSASVLMILERTLRDRPGNPGDIGLMLAMGPGFCSEYLLLRW